MLMECTLLKNSFSGAMIEFLIGREVDLEDGKETAAVTGTVAAML